MTERRRQIATRIAWAFLGKPYLWGGNDPVAGFDCSGFVIEILKSVGILTRSGDWTAHALWADVFSDMRVPSPKEGCLVFWRGSRTERVVHVEYCLDAHHSLGASGGGSATLTEADAITQDAYIKVRPFRTRTGLVGFVDPFMSVE